MNGKICYVEIPAADAKASSKFYADAFGWKVRTRGGGQLAFDDTTGAVSGTWVEGRAPARDSTLIVYIMVDDIDASLGKVTAGGGSVTTPRTAIGGGGAFAVFADPAGNTIGLYEEPR